MILCVGEALIDMVPVPYGDETAYLPRAGGSPYNVAIALGRLGADVAFLGRISRDPFGQLLRARLRESGVSLDYVVDTDDLSLVALVQVVSQVKPVFTFYRDPEGAYVLRDEEVPDRLEGVDILHFGSISLLMEPGATAITRLVQREAGRCLISFDPNVRPILIKDRDAYLHHIDGWVECSNIVKVSSDDVAWLYPGHSPDEVANRWLTQGATLVVITLGEQGAIAFTPAMFVSVPAPHVKVVDTIGAGDAFTAGLLFALQREGIHTAEAIKELSLEALQRMLEFAVHVGSLTCTRAGAEPPWLEEVRGYLGR